MQDTDKLQNQVLEKVFQSSIVQKIGDPDQTLNDDSGWNINEENKITINGSFRFPQALADCAKEFSASDLDLKGENGNNLQPDKWQKPIIFLFNTNTDEKQNVLKNIAQKLFEISKDSIWDEDGNQKNIKAVCPQHDKYEPGKPLSLKSYCYGYTKEDGKIGKKEKHYFDSFIEYCYLTQKLQYEDQKLIINKLKDGLVQALFKSSIQDQFEFRITNNEINEFFKKKDSHELKKVLLKILTNDLTDKKGWEEKAKQITKILMSYFSSYINEKNKLNEFFDYKSIINIQNVQPQNNKQAGNIVKIPINDSEKELEIELSTIDGAKGETHFATIVLYGKAGNNLLLKQSNTKSKVLKTNINKKVYVALTRASHFLCLALPSDKFDKEKLRSMEYWEIIDL